MTPQWIKAGQCVMSTTNLMTWSKETAVSSLQQVLCFSQVVKGFWSLWLCNLGLARLKYGSQKTQICSSSSSLLHCLWLSWYKAGNFVLNDDESVFCQHRLWGFPLHQSNTDGFIRFNSQTLYEPNARLAECRIESCLVPAVSSTMNLRGRVAMTTVTNVCA